MTQFAKIEMIGVVRTIPEASPDGLSLWVVVEVVPARGAWFRVKVVALGDMLEGFSPSDLLYVRGAIQGTGTGLLIVHASTARTP